MDSGPLTELTSRQETILALVVQEYVASGAPVGSRTLVEGSLLSVSSSTVRCELGALEEGGYLTHPHTSAGRTPTDAGYRFYVDQLLANVAASRAEVQLDLDLTSARKEVDAALRATTEALSSLTRLLALATAPPIETTVVRHVELLQLQANILVAVVITSAGDVSKRVFVLSESVEPRLVEWIAEYLNERLRGGLLAPRLLRATLTDPELGDAELWVLDQLRPAFTELTTGARDVYVGGAAGLIAEFPTAELISVQRLLEVLDERASVLELLRQRLDSKRPFVRVGSELDDPELSGVSLVGAPYGLSNRNLGTVSVLGPTRMDYEEAIAAVRTAARKLSAFVEELYD
ncbi:MAG: heat-inducible transcriptional repressor HrcA [Gaiellales bacterium]